ncbi:MAG: GTPase ObgE [Chlamydiia bacterium]|nr:GTPase ObgE [Chlamydiia bacterium]MCP5509649.1 GTPase ObgE [Chlamydiales bacterium]HPE85497.1 GTPase ObgE [Chlamydiales bacterium]
MFVDRIRLNLKAGKGGNGCVAWRREKYLPKGGPYGGNGGPGGSVIVRATTNVPSLDHYRNKRILSAENGQMGGSNCRQGRLGKNLIVEVPCGTLIKDPETNAILHDLTVHGQEVKLCAGGRGGLGNHFFKTSTRQAPNFATPGHEGDECNVELELKLIADIGLVGFPNAGKSTLFSSLTNRNSKAAPYPFTTLKPNLSFIQFENYQRAYIADIPGIIENAHQDRGLGLEFLRHIERTHTLLYVIDLTSQDPYRDFCTLRSEIEAYNPEMTAKPYHIILNKTDLEDTEAAYLAFRAQHQTDNVLKASAYTGDGLEDIVHLIQKSIL